MSELRQDPASGEWVVIAPGRSGRPHPVKALRAHGASIDTKKLCPFENPEKSGNWPPSLAYYEGGEWQILVLPNQYPALSPRGTPERPLRGHAKPISPYAAMPGIGTHELVVTRDHRKNFPHLSKAMALRVFETFAERFRAVGKDGAVYMSAFGNWGPSAGASLPHPHYQLLSLPVVPADVFRSLEGSKQYFAKARECVHCAAIKAERRARVRVVAENDLAIAFAPYASWNSYEVKIYPKRHISNFENSAKKDLAAAAELLQTVLLRMEKRLGSPDNNFFIHSAPLQGLARRRAAPSYHWHIEVVPKLSIGAGFELATGMDITTVPPEDAAKRLR